MTTTEKLNSKKIHQVIRELSEIRNKIYKVEDEVYLWYSSSDTAVDQPLTGLEETISDVYQQTQLTINNKSNNTIKRSLC